MPKTNELVGGKENSRKEYLTVEFFRRNSWGICIKNKGSLLRSDFMI